MSAMAIDPKEVRMIQESTVRPNIRYSVITYDSEVETLRHIINGKLAQYPTEDRVVVHCYKIKEMQSYTDEVGGAVFYSGVGEIEREREIMGMLTESDLTGKTRPFDPYKGAKSRASYRVGRMCKTTTWERPSPKKEVTPDYQVSITLTENALDVAQREGGRR